MTPCQKKRKTPSTRDRQINAHTAGECLQDPTKRYTKEEWQKKFAVFDSIRNQITPEDEEKLDQAIDRAVQEVRADANNAYGKDPA